jgi:hypothetical protein
VNNLNRQLIIFISIITLSYWGCKPDELIVPKKISLSPIEIGKYIIYDHTELNHDAFNSQTDTISYWIKETIESSFLDQENDTAYRLQIDHSNDEGKSWEFQHYSVLKDDDFGIERTDFDVKKVKLSFPVQNNKMWDINMFNNHDAQYGYYNQVDESFFIDDSAFDETVTIKIADRQDIIFTQFEEEIYARGIGLIQRQFKDIETQPGKYKDGIEYTETLLQTNW